MLPDSRPDPYMNTLLSRYKQRIEQAAMENARTNFIPMPPGWMKNSSSNSVMGRLDPNDPYSIEQARNANPTANEEAGLEMPMLADPYNYVGMGLGANVMRKFVAPKAAPADLSGLIKARENNTFVYDSNDMSRGYGRRIGFPQPAGASSDSLFSNFADTIKTPSVADKFRSDMLTRALKNPNQIANEVVNRSVIPFKDDMYVIVDAAEKGNTRLQVMKNNAPVAGARLEKGLIDSIAVDESAKGQSIGGDLLQFIHDNKIGNVFEVPDRSPGFVKIQKDLVKKLELAK
jgi:hypothetical protein